MVTQVDDGSPPDPGERGRVATSSASRPDIVALMLSFAIALQVPGCHWEYQPTPGDEDRWCVWFLDPDSRSWARFDYQPHTRRWPIHQFGPRRLWDEVPAACHRWDHAGRPPVTTHWRFTITPNEQRMELPEATPGEQG